MTTKKTEKAVTAPQKANTKETAVAKTATKPMSKLAVISKEQAESYMVLSGDAEARNDIATAVKENVGDGAIGINDLDRYKIPTGGSLRFAAPAGTLEDGEEGPKEIVGIIAVWKDNRAYWKEAFGAGNAKPPDCSSDDGKVGVGSPGGDCETCPLAQYGSKQGRAGQACKAMRTVFILEPGSLLPVALAAPPTSLRGLRQYFLRLAGQGVPYYGAVTKFTLMKRNTNGNDFSVVQLEPVMKLDREQIASVKAFSDGMRPALSRAARASIKPPTREEEDTGAPDDMPGDDDQSLPY